MDLQCNTPSIGVLGSESEFVKKIYKRQAI